MTYASNTVPKAPVLSEELNDNHFRKDPTGYSIKYDQPNSNVVFSDSADGIALNVKACELVSIQELMPNELVIDHSGKVYFVVPAWADGWTITEWTASVLTVGTVDIKAEIVIEQAAGGTSGYGTLLIPGGDRFADFTGAGPTLAQGDLVRVEIGSGGVADALGFTYTFKIEEP